ncbi:MAG: tellurite resistance TerB family protein [Halioglobus sp.]|nr:tellurite resistance TerB family protein [Halioglobus sp.]
MDVNKVLSQLAGSGVIGGLAGGALGGALVGNKKARKTAGTLLKAGGIAAVGTLAWKAYQGYQQDKGAADAGPQGQQPGTAIDPAWQALPQQGFTTSVQRDSTALLILKAMIAAAAADGHLDSEEHARVMARAGTMDLSAQDKALVFDALQSPLSLHALSEQIDCPEVASEVYVASALVLDPDNAQGRLYLEALAFRLGIPEGLALRLQQQALAAPEVAAA